MPPPAPVRLTTVSEVGNSFCSTRIFSTWRAVLSLLPPGAEPTTISTFFCGLHAPCAPQAALRPASAIPSSRLRIILFSPRLVMDCSDGHCSRGLLLLHARG